MSSTRNDANAEEATMQETQLPNALPRLPVNWLPQHIVSNHSRASHEAASHDGADSGKLIVFIRLDLIESTAAQDHDASFTVGIDAFQKFCHY